ncbi:helix-turn-helix domain-containing protein [Citrobacter sp. S39]|jgi:DNA invertase Pin-like site-specific DNA recombinase|uniref:recombinase family protein n=1 Tax=Enterobacteriaceae TaxID=543 RepID=UPI0012A9FE5A|nr:MULTISPECIES: recombinase family protein [Enterobacteriaceae]MBS7441075.1 recombinase family protein [Enterobacter sp. 120016]MDX7508871.1 recombinase family protein [Citrobacter freundii]QFX89886.1 helix-turn-helix domain-containing protein [Citrobacter sp. S39]
MANIGYVRVSTDKQYTERQLDGVTLDKKYEEKVSGKNANRPQLQEMIAYVREDDVIHVHSLDRLGRNIRDVLDIIEQVKDKGASVQFHKEGITAGAKANAASNLMLNIFAAMSQMEREQLLERQAEGYAAAKAAGRKGARGNGAAVDRLGIMSALAAGQSIRTIAKDFNVSTSTVQRIKTEQATA